MRIISAICMLCCLLFPLLLPAQNTVIRGKVTADDGNALPGVTVQVKGGTGGTTTGIQGEFSIAVPDTRATLTFSYVGFLTKDVPLNGQSSFTIVSLQPDTRNLEQVVVTALGIKKEKRALGYAVQDVSGADLSVSRQTNVVNALQGKVAGVQISSTGGAPGQGSRIIIRGINSLDPTKSNQPLFIVDGIPIDNETYTTGNATTRGMSNRAADINPDDIESISILRGGAATALYGLRAANGAVVITTRSGKAGRLKVSLTSTYGIEYVNKIPDVQTRYSQGYLGEYDPASFWPSWGPTVERARELDPTHPAQLYNNYKGAYRQGSQFRNTVGFTGGNEKVVFSGSFSSLDQDGVIPFSDYKSYSARLNGELHFSEKFKMGASINYINSGGTRVNADRYGEQLIYWSPRWDVKDYILPNGTQKTYTPGNDNPIWTLYSNRYKDNVNRVIGNVNFTYSPFKWLDLIYRVGTDFYADSRTHTAPGPRGLAGEAPNINDNVFGFVHEYQINKRTLNSTFIANFKNKISSRLNSDLKVGHDLYEYKLKRVSTEGDTLDIPDLYALQNAKRVIGDQYREDYRIIGVFADWTLDWDNYLYLTLTGRNDVTSTLPEGRNSFFYPSVSAGYVFTDHLQIPERVLTYGKIRASWARIGKDAAPYKLTSGYETLGNGPINNSTIGWSRANLKTDPELRPEFTNTFETGVELRFLANRLGLDFTWYTSKSTDLLMTVPIPVSSGYDAFYTNAGSIQNRGIEVSLNATPVKTKNFNWDMRINFSTNRNKVLSLRKDVTEIFVESQFGYISSDASMKYIVGYPVGAIFGRSYLRYYGSEKEDPLRIDKNRPLIIDSNGFPVINTSTVQKYLGNTQPKWIGAITNTFNYRQFGLSFLIDVRQGVQKYNQFANFMAAFGASKMTENREQTIVFDGIQEDGTPNTKPVYLGQGVGPDGVDYGNGYYRNVYRGITENFIEDASWVRLRNVSLSYRLPAAWLARTRLISDAGITLTGNNLWLHTRYTGFDPESSSNNAGSNADGFAGFTYPAVRSFLASINITF